MDMVATATRPKRQKFAVSAPGSVAEGPKRSMLDRPPGREGPKRSAPGGMSAGRPAAGECLICLSEDKHFTIQCPYLDRVPENAIVSSGCDVVCRMCGYTMKQRGKWICCNQEGYAVLKMCDYCMTSGEHWSVECPSDEGVDLARVLLTPIEDLSCDGCTGPLV